MEVDPQPPQPASQTAPAPASAPAEAVWQAADDCLLRVSVEAGISLSALALGVARARFFFV